MRESDLSNSAKQFLKEQGCTNVYGEVIDIDLVGKKGSVLIGVELKKSLNVTVLAQAAKRTEYVNYVYVGIPKNKFKSYFQLNPVYKLFIETHGIGIVLLEPSRTNSLGDVFIYYKVVKQPKIHRITPYKELVLNHMTDFTENRLGGQTTEKVLTPYKYMLKEVKDFLKSSIKFGDGWKTIDEILNVCRRVKDHYANPKGSLYQLLNRESWIEKDSDRKRYRYKGELENVTSTNDNWTRYSNNASREKI